MIIKEELTDQTITECALDYCYNITIDYVLSDWEYLSGIDSWLCPECMKLLKGSVDE